jgi:hypothetical protein
MASATYITAAKLIDLVTTADPKKSMFLQVLSATRLGIGPDPLKPVAVIDLAREKIVSLSEEPLKAPEPAQPAGTDDLDGRRSSRRGGEYSFELNGKRSEFHSLRDLLAEGLRALEKARPGTLEKLSHIKPRSRRIVARDPKELFDKGHLAKKYADKLSDGWYYGTNNSGDETNAWLERACSCAGLKWGEEFKTSLGRTLTSDEVLAMLK